ncbi:MAG: MBL fold metallo-hydrolase [Elusimicrobia bacterium]|nr:MBL fold metallo-hydrolase [Elusimicrobiota bacterium]
MPGKNKFFFSILFFFLFGVNAFARPCPRQNSRAGTAPTSAGRDLVVSFIDVGQGESVLVETPDGKNILMDGGGIPAWRKQKYKIGAKVVNPFLQKKKIKQLDKVILTHGHADHVDGLLDVLTVYPAAEFVDTLKGGGGVTDDEYINVLQVVKTKNLKYRLASAGDSLDFGPALQVLVLNPPQDRFDNPNDNSLVLKITYNKVSFLLTADIGQAAERKMLSEYRNTLQSTVLKVAHHGSRSSSCASFLNEVKPELAVISCGRNNTFGHPHPEVLQRLKRKNIPYLITAKKGTITVITDGQTYRVKTEY